MLLIHKPKCEDQEITTIRTSSESYLQWKKHFRKNAFHFRIYADFEADYDLGISNIGNKTTNIYEK